MRVGELRDQARVDDDAGGELPEGSRDRVAQVRIDLEASVDAPPAAVGGTCGKAVRIRRGECRRRRGESLTDRASAARGLGPRRRRRRASCRRSVPGRT